MSESSSLGGSERGTFPAASPTTERLLRLFRAHERPLDLTVSNPTRVGLALPRLLSLLAEAPDEYFPEPFGLPSARRAIAALYSERAKVNLEDVIITASTSESYSFLFGTLCDPGDAILVPRPSYPLFEQLAQLASVRLVEYELAYDGAWHIDHATLPSRSEVAEKRIRAVLVVSPNNPTGSTMTGDDLVTLAAFGLPLVVDEVFLSSRRGKEAPLDPMTLEDLEAPIVILDGLSKRLAAPGLKLAWMIAKGPHAGALRKRLEWYADSFLSVGGPVQAVLPALLAQEGDIRKVVQSRLDKSAAVLRSGLKGTSLTFLEVEAGWSVVVRLAEVRTEVDAWDRLAESGVWVQPGHFYGLPFASSIVVSLLTPEDVFQEGVERLIAAVG